MGGNLLGPIHVSAPEPSNPSRIERDPPEKATRRPARPPGSHDLSRYPAVYDAAFSWDRSQEARSYLQVAATRIGRKPRSAVELACGTGPLARLWGSWGLESYGMDRSPTFLSRARELGRGTIPESHWRLGDLRTFRLPRRVDLAVVPLDGIGYLVEEGEFLSFFRAARRSLLTGGVLAVDVTLHEEQAPPLPIRNSWAVRLRPKGRLRIDWRSVGRPWGSPPRQWEVAKCSVRIPGRSTQLFWDAHPHSVLSARRLGHLAEEAGGFRGMEVYSEAAHRPRGRMFQPTASGTHPVGPRLICWQRD
ncbi:MAG: class I SAM-dependent methyltransferase [Thermoplasmata archaeon]|nr:class I SAM-dependent methyltransferase [Thermoplasmata archaeon]